MDLLNETVLLKTKSTLFNLLLRETSQLLCYERLLNMTYVAYKNAFFPEMQFWSHCYTVVSYQALFRLSVYKIPAVYLWVQKMCVFARYATLVPRLISNDNYASLFWNFSYFPVEMDEYLYVWYRSLSLCCSTVRFMLLLLHLA